MKKNAVYYMDQKGRNPVWSFIASLSLDERNKCFEYIAYLEEVGEQIRRPVGDYLGGKLYELRPKQTRIIYFFMLRNYAVLLHAFRKTSNAIPAAEIKIALNRMNSFILRHQKGKILLGNDKS